MNSQLNQNAIPVTGVSPTFVQTIITQTPPIVLNQMTPATKRPRLEDSASSQPSALICAQSTVAPNFPGGINLTIANGAINIKPASSSPAVPVINPALTKGAVGTITTGSLTFHGPLISQVGGVNLKVPNPSPQLNIRGVLSSGMMGQLNIRGPGINLPRGANATIPQQAIFKQPLTDTNVHPVFRINAPVPIAPKLNHNTFAVPLPPAVTSFNVSQNENTIPLIPIKPVGISLEENNIKLSDTQSKLPISISIIATSGGDKQNSLKISSDIENHENVTQDSKLGIKKEVTKTVNKNDAIMIKDDKIDEKNGGFINSNDMTNAEAEDDDFDMESALIWENGIGKLPGSDLKFKMNEFGIMEMITEDFEEDDKSKIEGTKVDDPSQQEDEADSKEKETKSLKKLKKTDEILRCDNCGVYGMNTEFYHNEHGDFCEESCATMFENKQFLQKKLKEDKEKEKEKRVPVFNKILPKKKKRLEERDKKTPETEPVKPGKKSRSFCWESYLLEERAVGINPKLCKPGQLSQTNKNGFRVGMKLEGIDPQHPSLYCVFTVAEVKGYRIRLHFDGYSECYDFWVNADTQNIFPVGWCEKNNKILQTPKGFNSDTFVWGEYLKLSKAIVAPRNLFQNQQAASVTPHGFRLGMKLEAIDKVNTVLICVATVADVLGDRLLIHFDGWEDTYDYWADPTSPYIKPIGWCLETGRALSPPNDWKDIKTFTWEEYLTKTRSQPVPARAFKSRPPHQFEFGMKLEVVDRRNPILLRVATIVTVDDYRFKVHFDGWGDEYDFWVDDDCVDIHPPGWAAKTGHPLEPPISPQDLASSPSQTGCPTPGCKGLGHIKGAKYVGHHSAFGCPYSPLNLNREFQLNDRLGGSKIEEGKGGKESPEVKRCPTEGCDGSGHVTGKFTTHHKLSGCPLAEKNQKLLKQTSALNGDQQQPRRPGRPKKKKFAQLKPKFDEQQDDGDDNDDNDDNSLYNGIHQSIFMSAPTPAKELPLCWEQHSKILPGLENIYASDVALWNTNKVADFVRSLPGCQEQGQIFHEEQIDGEAFLLLTQTDIVKIMNIKLGPALKIYNSILMFKRKTPS